MQTDEGRTYDVRILVQKNNIGLWQLTGMAARIGKLGSITSNLHGGGSAYELLPVLQKQFEDKQAGEIMKSLSQLAMRIPLILEQYHGRLAELGIDIGIDPFGKLWIIEVNSKPGHSSFSHFSDPSVSRSSISNPIHYAGYLLNKFKKNEVSLLPQAHRRVT
ncbi:MAG: hypothetical protein A2189_00140 [Paenibacillus sp. RIFOXYA1_FULL_44_5]|nr:MAG: hypothetical protein A2189_00140 [Paenibacillus sp. RIFOXYA1_FULL_44_5]